MTASKPHLPIMIDEVLSSLKGLSIRTFFDGTLGAGGHAQAILTAHPEIERYIGCDKDPEAFLIAEPFLSPWKEKVELVHSDFSKFDEILKEKKIKQVDGFFLTLECHLCN